MSDGLPRAQRQLAFFAIALAMTMAVLDAGIVNVALPIMGHELGATPAQAIWIVNAYQLAITVSLLPLASLGDILGYKRVYLWGLAIFALASLACSSADTLLQLSCARMVQGLGAAGIMSVNIALVRFIFPKAQLGVGVGYASLVVAAASAAGPSIASAILSLASWQWLFMVNVPLGMLALLIAAKTLPVTPAAGHAFDRRSALLNVATFGLLIAGLMSLSQRGSSPQAWALVSGGLLVGLVYIRRELSLAAPMLPVDLLRMPVFSLSLATSICSFAAQTMAFIALPFYFQRSLGHTASQIGLLMTPWPLMTALVAPMAGRLSDRLAPEKISAFGLLVLAIGLASLASLHPGSSYIDIALRLAVCGLGFGLFQSPNNRVIVGSAPRSRSGGASGLQSMGRLLGQSIGAVWVAGAFTLIQGHQTAFIVLCGAALSLSAAVFSISRPRASPA